MTDIEAMEILRAQGHAVGAPDSKTGAVRVWIHGTDRHVDVNSGRDLIRLAEGSSTMEDFESELEKTRKGKHDLRQAGTAR
jgi:hypothetical protein